MASSNASHTGRAVARATTLARHHEPGMVIDTRTRSSPPRLPVADRQAHPAHDVHLPQLHRPGPLPPAIVLPATPPRLRLTRPWRIRQRSTDVRPGNPIEPLPLQPIQDRARPPPRMLTAHLHNPRLDLRGHLMRTRQRPRALIRQARPTRDRHKRPSHTCTVWRATPNRRATSITVAPSRTSNTA